MSERQRAQSAWVHPVPPPEFVARGCLVAALVAALGAAVSSVAQLLTGGDWTFLVAYCAFVALVAQWSTWFLAARLPQSIDRHWFRGVELGALGTLGLVGDALLGGQAGGLESLRTLGLRSIALLLLLAGAWFASVATAGDFARLGELPERDAHYVPPLEGLSRRFFSGGALLLAAVGITTVGPGRLLDANHPPIGGPILSALVYFPAGMILLALAQHTLLGRRWEEERTPIVAGLGGRWARLSLIFMALTIAIAFILPTAYGVGLLDILALIVRGLIYLLALLGIGATAPLFLLLSKLHGDSTANTATPPSPPPVLPPPAESSGLPWLDLLRWAIFAIVAVALTFWLLRGWLEHRTLIRGGLGRFDLLGWLRRWLSALVARLRGLATAIAERLPSRGGRIARRAATGDTRFTRLLAARKPREQILRYYLSLIRRADAQGLHRGVGQTPEEYADRLSPHVPEAGADLTALTAQFVEARYSRHELTTEASQRARGHWERLRDALRARQRRQDAGDR